MTLGALIDLGVDKDYLISELNKLDFGGYELVIQQKDRHSIKMMDVDVILTGAHEHRHEHEHGHSHGHSAEENNLEKIINLIDKSDISENAKITSKKIFTEIAAAEAKVHGKKIEEVHFHEVGAIDSIVDIVGTAICLDRIGADIIYASPLHDGNGSVECSHGILPVPVPAVMAMLEGSGIPLVQEDVGTEMVTPTGMGIVKCVASGFGKMPPMTIEKTGYGMGKRDTGMFGAVRAILGTPYEVENG